MKKLICITISLSVVFSIFIFIIKPNQNSEPKIWDVTTEGACKEKTNVLNDAVHDDKETASVQTCNKTTLYEFSEPDYEVFLLSDNWNLDSINCAFSEKVGCYGNGISIAVIDSGLSNTANGGLHVLNGYNYLDECSDVTDNIGHGTFVTGIIASPDYGIATCSQIVPLKCFDSGATTHVSDITQAIYDAVDIYHCKVINMSFGLKNNSTLLKTAVEYAAEKGIIMIAAVGNNGDDELVYPAAYECVIGVGSVGKTLNASYYSQHNKSVFVTAPGEEIESLRINGYTEASGTSFAAPHVTALAAMALNIQNDLTIDTFKNLLSETSIDLGDAGYDEFYGYGLINSEALMRSLLSDIEVFLSPVTLTESLEISVNVFSSMDEVIPITLLCASYEADGRMKLIRSYTLQVEKEIPCNVINQVQSDLTKIYIVSNYSFSPLSQCRIYESEERI